MKKEIKKLKKKHYQAMGLPLLLKDIEETRTLNDMQLNTFMGSECWGHSSFNKKYPMENKKQLDTLLKYKLDFYNKIIDELRQEVIKWIKKDMRDSKYLFKQDLIERWMERLNLTKEDLK